MASNAQQVTDPRVHVSSFYGGADSFGDYEIRAAIASLGGLPGRVALHDATYLITNSLTVPSYVTFDASPGTRVWVYTNQTLTGDECTLEAGNQVLFLGSGTLAGSWWCADGPWNTYNLWTTNFSGTLTAAFRGPSPAVTSITSNMFTPGAVDSAALADDSVLSRHVGYQALSNADYSAGSVNSRVVEDGVLIAEDAKLGAGLFPYFFTIPVNDTDINDLYTNDTTTGLSVTNSFCMRNHASYMGGGGVTPAFTARCAMVALDFGVADDTLAYNVLYSRAAADAVGSRGYNEWRRLGECVVRGSTNVNSTFVFVPLSTSNTFDIGWTTYTIGGKAEISLRLLRAVVHGFM